MTSNVPERSISERLEELDQKCTRLIELFEALKNNEQSNNQPNSQGNYIRNVDLENEINEVDNYDAALEALNQAGSDIGYSFKKGQSKTKGTEILAKTIVCKYYNRNKEKQQTKSSVSNKSLIKDINCTAFYRFKVNSDDTVALTTFAQQHNHQPIFSNKVDLTSQMKLEISKYNKRSLVSDIKSNLENSFSCKLDYWTVYREFREQFPRLGESDCRNFVDFLRKNECLYEENISKEDRSLCKLLFLTPKMLRNYSKFHDILLIDTTYNTNYYSIPLVVFSGIDNNFRNVVFGFGLINNESKETYQWVLSSFFKLVQDKCSIIISDGDHALCAAIKDELNGIPHRLCAWHLARNLRRKFGFLKSEFQSIKDKIFSLPYEKHKDKFDKNVDEILKFLTEKELENQKNYMENTLAKKEYWAESYFPPVFDGSISTTSRVESWNAFIKKYLNSKSEITDFIALINKIDKCEFQSQNDINSEVFKVLELDPLVFQVKNFLAFKLYMKQMKQYLFAKRYDSEIVEESLECITYSVFFTNDSLPNQDEIEDRVYQRHSVIVKDKISCSCTFLVKTGLVCRHVFHVCALRNIKSINQLIISDRWRKSLCIDDFPHFIAPPVQLSSLIKQDGQLIKSSNGAEILEIMSRKNSEGDDVLNTTFIQEDKEQSGREPILFVKRGSFLNVLNSKL